MAGRGIFIVLEGGDGAGKTTQSAALADWLAARGEPVVRTRQPGGSGVGQRIRELVLDARVDLDDRAEALLYAADKAQHVQEVVEPALRAGRIVVCDRYVDSMIAYQGAGRVLAAHEIAALAAWATHGLRPDLTVLLDVDPAEALAEKDTADRLESAGDAFHDRVRRGFLDLAAQDPQHYLVLPARGDRDEIAAAVQDRVRMLLEPR